MHEAVYWVALLPLAAAFVIALVRKLRWVPVALGLATALACIQLVLSLPLDDVTGFLGQQWMLDSTGQLLLLFIYAATAVLLAIAAFTEQAESFPAPALAGAGLLSAVILLRSSILSFTLLPVALLLLVLTASGSFPSAVPGASRFLVWTILPILCVPAVFTLLERFAVLPDQPVLAEWSAWLTIPPAVLWLTLFPFDGATRLWSRDGLSIGPVFLWAVKDALVIYLMLGLWRQYPMLQTENVTTVLGIAGLMTAVFSGVLAVAQSSPSAVLACAAMSELGVVLQGITTSTDEGVLGGLFLLLNRAVAVLLASASLAAVNHVVARESESNMQSFRWRSLLLLIAFSLSVLTMAGTPPLGGFAVRSQIYATLLAQEPYLHLAWLSASMGIALGLVRAGWSLWHAKAQSPAGRLHDLPLLLVLCLLLLCLWIGLHPQDVMGRISEWLRDLLPTFHSVSSCLTVPCVL